jgi:8-oxo-dGTP diphosphatase
MSARATAFDVTVDIVIFTVQDGQLRALLVRRKYPPFEGQWAIPGGFVNPDESLESAALRELTEETGVNDVYLEQLFTFGEPGRDPRGRVVTVAYFALVSSGRQIIAGSDAAQARWFSFHELPKLAFDHGAILDYAVLRLRNKLQYTTVGFQLLPPEFTLGELQDVYEAILGKTLDKRNFRRKMKILKVLSPLPRFKRQGVGPKARLYRFSAASFEKLKDKGILFPF